MTEPWAPGTTTFATASANPRRGRSALNQLNGGGGVIAAAKRLALEENDATYDELIHAVRKEERRLFADLLLEKIGELTFNMHNQVSRAEVYALINKWKKRDPETEGE